MAKFSSLLLVFVLLSIIIQHVRSVEPAQPRVLKPFEPKTIQTPSQDVGSCLYTLVIHTARSSPTQTRDRINLAFGDSNGNEVYAERLDDPSSGVFERCSTDNFEIAGPCAAKNCYQYFLRQGTDGWKPKYVEISNWNSGTVNFTYNSFLPK